MKKQDLVGIAAITIVSQGCAGLGYVEFSKGSAAGVPVNTIAGGRTFDTAFTYKAALTLPGLNLEVTPHNAWLPVLFVGIVVPVLPLPDFTSADAEHSPFVFDLSLDPEGRPFAFDPAQVTLQTAQGENHSASGYLGPAESCQPWGPKTVEKAHGPIPVVNRTCFRVLFDMTPLPPGQPFVLNIDGAQVDGKPFPIPAIRFANESTWAYRLIWIPP